MQILLHTPTAPSDLFSYYERAFRDSRELFVVTAYLTEWDETLLLNSECRIFRVIVGTDFGITRKAACEKIMHWLPRWRKSQFMAADQISGFHPKAVFWREKTGKCFSLIGSSNLTRAAFETNYEANVFCELSESHYARGRAWVKEIEKRSVVVSEDWLKRYNEAKPQAMPGKTRSSNREQDQAPLTEPTLPTPRGMGDRLRSRRKNLEAYEEQRDALERLFRQCADGQVSSKKFYEELPSHWSFEVGDRMQGSGWEIKGKHSDFKAVSRSFVNILDATDEDRDDAVREEIDGLRDKKVPTRSAFLSEMLCLRFPSEYPVLAEPLWKYIKNEAYKAPRGSSEGAYFIFLAKTLRASLLRNPKHPAKNLAELDTVIWLAYGKRAGRNPDAE